MPESTNFEDYIYVNKLFLSVVGVWPLPINAPTWRSRLQNCHLFIFYSLLLLLMVVPMALDIYVYWGNIEATVQNLCVSLHTLTVLMKLSFLLTKKKTFQEILGDMEKNWNSTLCSQTSEDKRNVLLNYAKFSRKLSKFFCCTVYLLEILMFLTPIAYGINSDPFRKKRYPVCAWYFYADDSTGSYILFYLLQLFLIVGLGLSFIIGMDSFFCVAICHFSAQLAILQKELLELGSDLRFTEGRVKQIVQKHNQQIKTVSQINQMFGKIALYQLLLSCISICITGFQTIVNLNNDIIDFRAVLYYIIFFFANLFHILLYCWPCNDLMIQSLEIGNAAYQASWLNLSRSSSQAIILIILMSQKSLSVKAGGIYVLSLENFTRIVKTSMSCLSGLRAFYTNSNNH